ncbi:MAG: type II toxin-antitoxin system HicB family antitoxin [Pyrinomonadaceae bacterium]
MLSYRSAYKFLPDGVHGEVLDFPGTLTCGKDIEEARKLLAGALVDMAETNLMLGEPLPTPDPTASDAGADIVEPIHLILNASAKFTVVPELVYETA